MDKGMQTMKTGYKIDEKTAMEKDVKAMSYDDLMAAIRFLDTERQMFPNQFTALPKMKTNGL